MSSQRPSTKLADHLLVAGQQEASWVVRLDDHTEKTLSLSQIVEAYNDRLIAPETYVWTDGMSNWQQLQAVDSIVDALYAAQDDEPPAVVHTAAVDSRPAEQASPSTAARKGGATSTKDDSAIFSLASLVGSPQHASDQGTREDSGLIDLSALQAAASASVTEADPVPPILTQGLFAPAEPTPAAPVPIAEPPARGGGDRRIVFGLLGAVAVLATVVVFLLFSDSQESTATAVTEASSGAADIANEPTRTGPPPLPPTSVASSSVAQNAPATSASIAAAPSASSASPQASSTAAQKTVAKWTPRTTTTAKRGSGTTPPVRPAKKKGCPCPPDDLMCAMRCATNR